jgi:hypothetical protein
MDIVIVNMLIVIFFPGVCLTLLVVTRERASEKAGLRPEERNGGAEIRPDKAAFALLGAILAFVFVLTVVLHRGRN